MSLFNKFSGGRSSGNIASRASINFAEAEKKQVNFLMPVVLGLVILAVGIAIAKFAFIDRLNEVKDAENVTAERQQTLATAKATIASFGDLATQYWHYTYSGMSAEEITRSDRAEILKQVLEPISQRDVIVNSWTLVGNVMQLSISSNDANALTIVKNTIETTHPLVSGCTEELRKFKKN